MVSTVGDVGFMENPTAAQLGTEDTEDRTFGAHFVACCRTTGVASDQSGRDKQFLMHRAERCGSTVTDPPFVHNSLKRSEHSAFLVLSERKEEKECQGTEMGQTTSIMKEESCAE